MLPDECPLTTTGVTFIRIADDCVEQAVNQGEKRDLVSHLVDGDLLLCAWTGQWHTDLFELPRDKIPEKYKTRYPKRVLKHESDQ